MTITIDKYGAFVPVSALMKWVLQIIQMYLTLDGDALELAKLDIVQRIDQLSTFTLFILNIFIFSIGRKHSLTLLN